MPSLFHFIYRLSKFVARSSNSLTLSAFIACRKLEFYDLPPSGFHVISAAQPGVCIITVTLVVKLYDS